MVAKVNTVPQGIEIFDRKLLQQRRARAAHTFNKADFLFTWTADNLRDRLSIIQRKFETIVQLGARGGDIVDNIACSDISAAFSPNVIAEEDFLPFKTQSLDCVISALNLHSVNDLPGSLIQIKQALKPDGAFIAALFGGETLYELRQSLNAAEMDIKGGLSPRVFPFADKQEMGALMQRAGFALPVVDSEIITVTYDTMFKLLHDIRHMGESNIIAARDTSYAGRELFLRAAQHYAENFAQDDGRIIATFEIIFVIGWAPHESQQKPLAPGSAKTRLADILNAKEESL